MSALTPELREAIATAYEVDARILANYKTRNLFMWYISRAVSTYLRGRAADIRRGTP